MIKYVVGNLLDVTDGIIVHGCNNQGVMGAGVAAAIRNKYPACYDYYHSLYQMRNKLVETVDANNVTQSQRIEALDDLKNMPTCLGGVIWWKDPDSDILIANAITQEGFGQKRDTCYNAIDEVFDKVFYYAQTHGIDNIHIPLVGSGIGGGAWSVIESIILDRAARNEMRLKTHCPGVNITVYCLTEQDIPNWRWDSWFTTNQSV